MTCVSLAQRTASPTPSPCPVVDHDSRTVGKGVRFGAALDALLRAVACGLSIAVALTGCATAIPKDRYGVASVEIRGADKLDDQALLACLATRKRESGFTDRAEIQTFFDYIDADEGRPLVKK